MNNRNALKAILGTTSLMPGLILLTSAKTIESSAKTNASQAITAENALNRIIALALSTAKDQIKIDSTNYKKISQSIRIGLAWQFTRKFTKLKPYRL